MSALVRGNISDTNLSRNAKGGTEQMRDRLLRVVHPDLLKRVSIHFSRVRPENYISGIPNILYCHDLVFDPESKLLANDGYKKFAKIVFVSYWQRDQYVLAYGIPLSHCTVIENAIESPPFPYDQKPDDGTIRFIYHTTPHRGLQLLVPIFEELAREYSNIHLDVYSSFGVYGWSERDKPYEPLFDWIKTHPNMTYHGAKPNDVVIEALKRSHVFLYPCIWQETSCIAMIEAIRMGLVVIHPNYGALPETADGATIMYDYTEVITGHLTHALQTAQYVLGNSTPVGSDKVSFDELKQFVTPSRTVLPANSIDRYARRWSELIKGLTA